MYVFSSSLCQRAQCRSNSLIPNFEVEVLSNGTQVTFGHYAIIYAPTPGFIPFSPNDSFFFLLSSFHARSWRTRLQPTSAMSYTNTVLLTGGTGGLGYYAALNIAQKHPKYMVIITGRSDPNSSAKKSTPNSPKRTSPSSPSTSPLLPKSAPSQNHGVQRTIYLSSPWS